MPDLCRRDFLKLFGMVGTGAALYGCGEPAKRYLIPYVDPPEDLVPGFPEYYTTTCRECPADCGMMAKNREGRIIKVEGNPAHPVSRGKLCMRGQASLHGLYNPDRFWGPMQAKESKCFKPIAWDWGEGILVEKLSVAVRRGGDGRVVIMTDLITGSLKDLMGMWLTQMGQKKDHIMYEPWSYEPMKKTNQAVFCCDAILTYRFDELDFLVSFNAGYLETWLSNLEFARQHADFHAVKDGRKNIFVFVGPRLSMTANNVVSRKQRECRKEENRGNPQGRPVAPPGLGRSCLGGFQDQTDLSLFSVSSPRCPQRQKESPCSRGSQYFGRRPPYPNERSTLPKPWGQLPGQTQ